MTARSPLRLLLLEDDPHDAELIRALLEADGAVCAMTRVQAREEFLRALENDELDLILADYQLPSFDGISALRLALSARPDLPFIFVSGIIGEELAIEALKIGATDYVLKTRLSRLVPSVHRALREAAERAERKKAEQALRQAQAELAHVTRVTTLGELAASIAHEINQPLAAIVTDATAGQRWLDRPVPDLGEARQALGDIVKSANRAAEVIARIRDLTRKTPTQQQQLDLNEVVREVAALTRAELVHNRVELRTELADDLPPVRGDRIELQQVVLNLIMNAVEAMSDADKRALRIASARDGQNDVRLSVCDSGRGLDPAVADHMFQAFYTTKSGGMGMGLAICRSIIQRHRGELSARPNAPCGAILQFNIPIA
jgi:C4-dicarboxylate-specific signal transduction histidine kinase